MGKLTMKMERYCQEYVKANGNAETAVSLAYPDITTRGARAVMSSKLQKNKNVQAKINELKAPIFDSLPEVAEMVMQKLMVAFKECESHRDMDKLGRTLLEVGGFLSPKTLPGQGNTVNVQINYSNQASSGQVESLKDMGVNQLLAIKAAVEAELNDPSRVALDVAAKKRLDGWNVIEQSNKQTVDCLPSQNNTNPSVIDVELKGEDCLAIKVVDIAEGNHAEERKEALLEGAHPPPGGLI